MLSGWGGASGMRVKCYEHRDIIDKISLSSFLFFTSYDISYYYGYISSGDDCDDVVGDFGNCDGVRYSDDSIYGDDDDAGLLMMSMMIWWGFVVWRIFLYVHNIFHLWII